MIHQVRSYALTLDDGNGLGLTSYEVIYDGLVPDRESLDGLLAMVRHYQKAGRTPIISVFLPEDAKSDAARLSTVFQNLPEESDNKAPNQRLGGTTNKSQGLRSWAHKVWHRFWHYHPGGKY